MTAQQPGEVSIMGSRHLPDWLHSQQLSLAFTTYQAGKLFMAGMQDNGRISIFERTFSRCMGMWSDGQTLWMSSLYQLWRFENALAPHESHNGYDRLYIPRAGFTTGDIDIHDVAVGLDGEPIFVTTAFSSLAKLSHTHSFKPVWQPPFISKLAPEDRCHMNGLAMDGGKPKYVSAVSRSDVADGWRDHRRDGGIVMDIDSGEIVAEGLSMPHSPRLHGGTLWVLNSGAGSFGYIDIDSGKFEAVTFLPGYGRGLAFVGDYAVVGLSRPRHGGSFSGLSLDDNLAARHAIAQSGMQIIDLRTGDVAHWLRVEGLVEELYDVAVLPGARRPMMLGFKTDEIQTILSVEHPPG